MSKRQHPFRVWRKANKRSLQSVCDSLRNTYPVDLSHLSRVETWINRPSLSLAITLSKLTRGAVRVEDFEQHR